MSEQALRILVLADGSSFHADRYVAELRCQGCIVELASLENGESVTVPLRRRGRLSYWLVSRQVQRLIRDFDPDVINPHYICGYGFVSALASLRRQAPVFAHLWGSDILVVPQQSALQRWKVRFALARTDFVCGDSEYLLNAARRLCPFQCRSAVIPWGIEKRYLALYRNATKVQSPLQVIVPRAHEPVYNNLVIVRALRSFVLDGRVTLTFPDFGSRADQFKRDAGSLVGDKLKFYRRLPRDQFMKLMAAHDVYVSNASSDSSPASMIEAMALGLIPVVADHPGVREWLNAKSGYIFEPYVTSSLADTIAHIIKTGDDYAEVRRRNLDRVRKRGLFENNVAQTIGYMRTLVRNDAK